MYNEKSKKNLRKFSSEYQPKKKGRPKGSLSITNEIKKILEQTDEASKKTVAELLARSATKHAMKGNAAYFKEIVNRIDGKINDKTEPAHEDKGPITFRVIYNEKTNQSEE
ncbi:MAG: hypothetical protein JW902_11405 [Syntrophaceae bacterium]|nr:hypothetical protein [Syntrophaceae bacterium]